jgi:polyferredoxin
MKKLVIARRLSQAIFLLIFLGILWPFAHPLKDFLSSRIFTRTDPLVMIFSSVSQRVVLQGLAFSLGMLLATLLLGRFFCGWVCPLGTVIDLTGALRKRKVALRDRTKIKVRAVKFYILGVIAIFSLFGIYLAGALDPMVIMARFFFFNLVPVADFLAGADLRYFMDSGIIFLVFVLICSSAIFISRVWCRAICPLGAIYALVARFSLLRRVVTKCDNCGVCISNCRTGAIKDDSSYVKGECILCMDCVYDCPQKATKFTWGFFRRH